MTQIEINELYKTNKDFKEYVDRYARCHRMMPDDAQKSLPDEVLKLAIVKYVAESKVNGR